MQHKSQKQQIGHNLFKQFNIVVDICKQICVQDTWWVELLDRQREGDCIANDVAEGAYE